MSFKLLLEITIFNRSILYILNVTYFNLRLNTKVNFPFISIPTKYFYSQIFIIMILIPNQN